MKKLVFLSLISIPMIIGLSSFVTSFDFHTSKPINVNCPIDGKEFTIHVTTSMKPYGQYTDFEKQGNVGNHYKILHHSCPICKFSGYKEDFSKTYTGETKKELKTLLEDYRGVNVDHVKECEITAAIYKYFERPQDDIANNYLVASYLLRNDEKRAEQRIAMQLKAAEHFTKGIELKQYPVKKVQPPIHYIIGEMYRRTGKFEDAVKHYNLALKGKKKPKWLKGLAREQKALAVQKNDENDM